VTPAERVREIQAYFQFDLSLLDSLDRLLAEKGMPKQLPPIFFASGIDVDPNNVPSFSAALRVWLEQKQDLLPERVQEIASRIGWPEEMRRHIAGGTVNSSELWARAFAADGDSNEGWAILVSEGLFGFFKDLLNLIFSGVLFENGLVSVKQTPFESDSKRLAEILGSYIETGIPSVGITHKLHEGQLRLCEAVYESGIEFILFHELMHVMKGHHEAAAGRAVKTTLLQEAVHNHREEFEADKLGFALLLRTWKGRHEIAFTGTSLLLQSLMLLERYPSLLQVRRTHPPAAERLLRLRADAPGVFSLLQDNLDEVRSLENALSHRLQLVADGLPQESEPIVSPWNGLFGTCADIQTSPVPEPLQLRFISQAITWIVLGDRQIACSTLGEAWRNAEANLQNLKQLPSSADPGDLRFYANACSLVVRLVDWLRDQGEAGKTVAKIIEKARSFSKQSTTLD
jgi:hypothetical protein